MAHEEPIDHPSLAKYPDSPTALSRVDGGPLYRVPIRRDRDEAVPIPVSDLVQARTAIHQLRRFVSAGAGDEMDVQMLGQVLVHGTADEVPETRDDVIRYLEGVERRIGSWLPYW